MMVESMPWIPGQAGNGKGRRWDLTLFLDKIKEAGHPEATRLLFCIKRL
jgi:hypothetical protein